jgi:hypothetical protein
MEAAVLAASTRIRKMARDIALLRPTIVPIVKVMRLVITAMKESQHSSKVLVGVVSPPANLSAWAIGYPTECHSGSRGHSSLTCLSSFFLFL